MYSQPEHINYFNDKSILITGATGSFGQSCVGTLLSKAKPRRLVIFSRDELKQYEMAQRFPEDKYPVRYFIGDVRDRERVIRACHGIDIIIHAAAMKHVTASEYNPTECIATNVMGAQNVIGAAIDNKVERVLALSTDKAANPINLYGATKLCSDKLFVAANNLSGRAKTRFAVVRYGNVAGSRGSVIPLFKKMAQQGETVFPVTHEEMTRFIIKLDDGVDLVLMTLAVMSGGEIVIPKLPSSRVVDLIPHVKAGATYKIIGVRAGEKLHEVMIPREEARNTVDMGKYYIVQPAQHWWDTEEFFARVRAHGKAIDDDFEYASNTNDWWLTSEQTRALVDGIGPA